MYVLLSCEFVTVTAAAGNDIDIVAVYSRFQEMKFPALSQCGGANFRFDELNQDDGILHFVTGTYGIQNPLLVKSGNSGFLIFSKN